MDNQSQKSMAIMGTAASPVTLDTSYDTSTHCVGPIAVRKMNQLVLYVYYAQGAGGSTNSIQVRLAFSPDEIAESSDLWAIEQVESVSSTQKTLTNVEYTHTGTKAAGTYEVIRVPVPLTDGYLRVQVKETVGAGSAGTAYIRAERRGR